MSRNAGPIFPMLATHGVPPTGPGWAFEWKWDGYRLIASTEGQFRLTSRRGTNLTDDYPELAVLRQLVERSVVLDGEVVALAGGAEGIPAYPSLRLLQHRSGATVTPLLMAQIPVYYHVFDLLRLDGESVMGLPYIERRRLLDELGLPTSGGHVVAPPNMIEPADWPLGADFGTALLKVASAHHLEGIVAKKLTSKYQLKVRSPHWIKTRLAEWRTK
jgi:bifunctional non-homologous end joining protein LigD